MSKIPHVFEQDIVDNCSISKDRKIIIYQSELNYLSQCILDYPQIETGGNLFGFWTPFGIPVVHYVVGPGEHAIHHVAHFRQDYHFLEMHADQLVEEHALHHIGSWHSHHSLGLTEPSRGDSISTLEGMQECDLQSFLLLIGNCREGESSVQAYRYHSDGTFEQLVWVVLQGISPIRFVYDKSHHSGVYVPKSPPNMKKMPTCRLIEEESSIPMKITYPNGYWLNSHSSKQDLVRILHLLKSKFDDVRVYQKEDKTIHIEVSLGVHKLDIHFTMEFPQKIPSIHVLQGLPINFDEHYTWDHNNVVESFVQLIHAIRYDI